MVPEGQFAMQLKLSRYPVEHEEQLTSETQFAQGERQLWQMLAFISIKVPLGQIRWH